MRKCIKIRERLAGCVTFGKYGFPSAFTYPTT